MQHSGMNQPLRVLHLEDNRDYSTLVRSKLEALGQDIYPRERQTPQALAAQQKAEIEKWWPIIKAGNIKVE